MLVFFDFRIYFFGDWYLWGGNLFSVEIWWSYGKMPPLQNLKGSLKHIKGWRNYDVFVRELFFYVAPCSYEVLESRCIRYYNYLLWHPTGMNNTSRLVIMVVYHWDYQFKFYTVSTDGNWCTAHLHVPSMRFNIYNQSIIEVYVNERLEEKMCSSVCNIVYYFV